MILAAPCMSVVLIGNCQPSQERAETPKSLSAMANRATVTCSPVDTMTSYSRVSWTREISRAQDTNWLVVPDMADTTTATS